MDDSNKTIRFIDSEYRELFKIPDGGNIRIVYPPGDDRGILTVPCKSLGEMHVRVGRNDYHICEFAERMERIGARYEPEVQLQNAEIVPIAPGEEKFCTYNREEGNTCVGHIAGEFGQQGDRFHSYWSDRENGRNTPEFQTELHSAVYALRQSVLKDYGTMRDFCQNHPEAKLPDRANLEHYGFKLDTESRQYFILCVAEKSSYDSHFAVYAYDKGAPVIEQGRFIVGEIQTGTADERKMFYRNNSEGCLSVGYLRGDFGKSGAEFHHNWFDNGTGKNTPEFKTELQIVVDSLRQDVLKDLKSTQDFCYSHPKAQLPGDIHRYGFKLETETRQYFVRCTVLPNDYFYVFAYDKSAVREQERSAGEKPSVMEKIRDAQKTPKKPKSADKTKTLRKKKDDVEL